MGKYGSFLIGALMGGLMGALVGLLLAPSSGGATRSQITGYATHVRDEVSQAAQQRRTELEQQLSRLRQPAA